MQVQVASVLVMLDRFECVIFDCCKQIFDLLGYCTSHEVVVKSHALDIKSTLRIYFFGSWVNFFFGRLFVKRFALCYQTIVCLSVLSCLSRARVNLKQAGVQNAGEFSFCRMERQGFDFWLVTQRTFSTFRYTLSWHL